MHACCFCVLHPRRPNFQTRLPRPPTTRRPLTSLSYSSSISLYLSIPRVTCRRDVTPALVVFPKSTVLIRVLASRPPCCHRRGISFRIPTSCSVRAFLACFSPKRPTTQSLANAKPHPSWTLTYAYPDESPLGICIRLSYPGLAWKDTRRGAAGEEALTAVFVPYLPTLDESLKTLYSLQQSSDRHTAHHTTKYPSGARSCSSLILHFPHFLALCDRLGGPRPV
ncbi:hypothetical protein LX32DRAFT_119236 [Colletotrichum zoysiae]|uniref:Uncharacterized protein n=1 Tax=Colletotrichum zoysiae TaxID=1216348 RepID=A0AAD9LX52_9PEZI|nr:hypothetical protein LX32DRAFT_119236 [Colletotrichum zoysiae]